MIEQYSGNFSIKFKIDMIDLAQNSPPKEKKTTLTE